MSGYSTAPIDSPEVLDDESPSTKPDEKLVATEGNKASLVDEDDDDPLLMDSPTEGNKEIESSIGDDFEKLEDENISTLDPDHKDHLGDDFDIIGEIDDQHFEVLDSAGDTEGEVPLSSTKLKTADDSHLKTDIDSNVKEDSTEKDKDEIDVTTSEDIKDKDSSSNKANSKNISPIRFEKSPDGSSKKKSDSSSSSKGDSGTHRITDKLFQNTRYFVMKSNNFENVDIAKTRNVWSTLPYNEKKLNKAYRDCRNVLLIYSVKESGSFQGFAKLVSESRSDTQRVPWVLPPTISASQLGSVFKLDWIHRGSLDFNLTMDLKNPWNENKPVKISRDGQEIEPSIGERLCRLWMGVSEDSSSAHREKRKPPVSHSRKDSSLPYHMTPMIPPHFPTPMPIFHDGRHPHQIHLNPALYPPPSKHHMTEAEELLSSKRRKTERGSSSHSKSDRVIRHHSRSPVRDHRDKDNSRRHRGETSRRRRSRSRSRSSERHSRHREDKGRYREKSRKSGGQSSSSVPGSSTFEKNFGVSKETLLHGSYADYIKEYTARSSRTGQPPMNLTQIASQYQKALSQVASALASQTATQQPLDPQTYNKKVEEFLERTKQKP